LVGVLAVPTTLGGLYPALILAIIAPALVFVGASIDCNNMFDATIAKFLGWISYPIYCLHFPIGRAVFLLAADRHLTPVEAASLSAVITIVAAAVLTGFYDRPMRAYLTRWLLPGSKAAAVTKPVLLNRKERVVSVPNKRSLFSANFGGTKV
jgi:peptidoglycan/LPS O-acetylase OafA/YrhL